MLYRSDSEMGAGDKVWVLMATFFGLTYWMIDGVSIVELYLCFRIAADATTVALWHCGKYRYECFRSSYFPCGCVERRDFSFAVPRGDSGMAGGDFCVANF